MTLTVKRNIHVHVKVDMPFKKNYILLINRMIEDLEYNYSSYKLALKSKRADASYAAQVTHKMNETLLQIEQLKQKIAEVKVCKDGDLFLVSTLDGHVQVTKGSDLLSVLGPVSIQAEGSTITHIVV